MHETKTHAIRCRIEDDFGLHKPYTMRLTPGYTALVGPNGAGKTTLLRQLADIGASRGYRVLKYANLTDGGHVMADYRLFRGDTKNFIRGVMSSEGENVFYNFGDVVEKIGRLIRDLRMDPEGCPGAFVLLDGIDSGTSIDKQKTMMELFSTIEADITENGRKLPLFVVNAVNSYVFAGKDCVDVRTGRHVSFESYDAYVDFVCDYFK